VAATGAVAASLADVREGLASTGDSLVAHSSNCANPQASGFSSCKQAMRTVQGDLGQKLHVSGRGLDLPQKSSRPVVPNKNCTILCARVKRILAMKQQIIDSASMPVECCLYAGGNFPFADDFVPAS
jgi:hypothetical protein